eukprot:TRINITY_DN129645_c0_g2_i1.p1 TRINITY_DN129645_c0_g2~~TRINITY_DN129645_c0_g2_i1.p1  ORF type:complete len:1024 (-),score=204.79 TRINITY_DN129645_c0_g2_i1:65-3136(-)
MSIDWLELNLPNNVGPHNFDNCSCSSSGTSCFLLGGGNLLWEFSVDDLTWVDSWEIPAILGNRTQHLSAVFNEFLFVIGGESDGKQLKDIWVINLSTHSCDCIGEMPYEIHAKSHLIVAGSESKLFLIMTGLSDAQNDQMVVLDLFSNDGGNTISMVDSKCVQLGGNGLTRRYGHSSLSVSEYILIFGGATSEGKLCDRTCVAIEKESLSSFEVPNCPIFECTGTNSNVIDNSVKSSDGSVDVYFGAVESFNEQEGFSKLDIFSISQSVLHGEGFDALTMRWSSLIPISDIVPPHRKCGHMKLILTSDESLKIVLMGGGSEPSDRRIFVGTINRDMLFNEHLDLHGYGAIDNSIVDIDPDDDMILDEIEEIEEIEEIMEIEEDIPEISSNYCGDITNDIPEPSRVSDLQKLSNQQKLRQMQEDSDSDNMKISNAELNALRASVDAVYANDIDIDNNEEPQKNNTNRDVIQPRIKRTFGDRQHVGGSVRKQTQNSTKLVNISEISNQSTSKKSQPPFVPASTVKSDPNKSFKRKRSNNDFDDSIPQKRSNKPPPMRTRTNSIQRPPSQAKKKYPQYQHQQHHRQSYEHQPQVHRSQSYNHNHHPPGRYQYQPNQLQSHSYYQTAAAPSQQSQQPYYSRQDWSRQNGVVMSDGGELECLPFNGYGATHVHAPRPLQHLPVNHQPTQYHDYHHSYPVQPLQLQHQLPIQSIQPQPQPPIQPPQPQHQQPIQSIQPPVQRLVPPISHQPLSLYPEPVSQRTSYHPPHMSYSPQLPLQESLPYPGIVQPQPSIHQQSYHHPHTQHHNNSSLPYKKQQTEIPIIETRQPPSTVIKPTPPPTTTIISKPITNLSHNSTKTKANDEPRPCIAQLKTITNTTSENSMRTKTKKPSILNLRNKLKKIEEDRRLCGNDIHITKRINEKDKIQDRRVHDIDDKTSSKIKDDNTNVNNAAVKEALQVFINQIMCQACKKIPSNYKMKCGHQFCSPCSELESQNIKPRQNSSDECTCRCPVCHFEGVKDQREIVTMS